MRAVGIIFSNIHDNNVPELASIRTKAAAAENFQAFEVTKEDSLLFAFFGAGSASSGFAAFMDFFMISF